MAFENKNMLLIGGTGSFGTAFLRYLLTEHTGINKIVVYSRDEQKQYELATALSPEQRKKVEMMIGDVRDRDRLDEAMNGIHIVVHAAAMKHMPIAEANPDECFKTNIIGTQNLVYCALTHGVERVVGLSTDKAVMPINAYGASKLYLEKVLIAGNTSPRNKGTRLSAVRYANVLGSRGSVVPFFQKVKATGELPITDFNMTRFSITMQQGIDIVMHALLHSEGGEVFVPKAPSYKITTVAEAVAPGCKLREVGIRHNEKLSEMMVSRYEASRTVEFASGYAVLPWTTDAEIQSYVDTHKVKRVPGNFEYDSATNTEWLSVENLREQIAKLS